MKRVYCGFLQLSKITHVACPLYHGKLNWFYTKNWFLRNLVLTDVVPNVE